MKFLTVAFWKALALKYGVYALAFNAFIEAIFFPIPPDILLITLCLTKPENSFFYAIVATLFSSLGGVVGYYVGYFGGKPLAERFFGEERVKKVHRLYESYESVIILLAGFSPLPYKLFTVTSGILFASLKKLFIFSLIGRGSRFFAEGALIYFFGEDVKNFALRNLNLISLIIGLLILVSFIIYRRYRKGILP